MWFIGGLGFCGSLLAFILSFIPPSQISVGSNAVWFSVLIIGALIVVIAPLLFIHLANPVGQTAIANSNHSIGKKLHRTHQLQARQMNRMKPLPVNNLIQIQTKKLTRFYVSAFLSIVKYNYSAGLTFHTNKAKTNDKIEAPIQKIETGKNHTSQHHRIQP